MIKEINLIPSPKSFIKYARGLSKFCSSAHIKTYITRDTEIKNNLKLTLDKYIQPINKKDNLYKIEILISILYSRRKPPFIESINKNQNAINDNIFSYCLVLTYVNYNNPK